MGDWSYSDEDEESYDEQMDDSHPSRDKQQEGDDLGERDDFIRTVTQAPVDLAEVSCTLAKIPTTDPIFREMIRELIMLQQTHGDADAALALQLADIESTLRMHVLMIHRQPDLWIKSILASMGEEEEIDAIDRITSDLGKRRSVLSERVLAKK